jgi:hypothetical protein
MAKQDSILHVVKIYLYENFLTPDPVSGDCHVGNTSSQ